MKRRNVLALLGASLLATPARAADSFPFQLFSRRTSRRPLLIAGSSAMAELSVALAKGFAEAHPQIDVVTAEGSSLSALLALRRGSIDVAAMIRDLTDQEDEKGIRSYLIARTGIDIVVSNDSPLTALTSQQVRGILSGQIDNWAGIGQKTGPIQIIAGAPSQRLIEEQVLPHGYIPDTARVFKTPQEAAYAVEGDPQAIGFIQHAEKWEANVRSLTIDGVDDTNTTLLSHRYPFTQSLYFVVMNDDPASTSALFVNFACSAAGQKIISQLHLIGTS